jgi:glycosyltransferase involved in cell wall biosynthesis
MKILVFAHQLEVGGTQTNAIELAAALRDIHGCEVVLFASPGPRVKLVEEKGLRYLAAPDVRFHPALSVMRALREAVRREGPDLLHVWDWWQCVEAYYAVHLPMRIPMVVTDMRMTLTRILPRELLTTFGTPELVDRAKAAGRKRAELLLPVVDVHLNAPDTVDPGPFRKRYGIEDGELVVVTVSRLANFLKAESLFRTLDAIGTLGRHLPLRFMIVGDGLVRGKLEHEAAKTNARLGRSAVILTGELLDPRPAYAAADIFIGMGSSALRAMAFGKPTIIVGEQNFSAPFTPETAESFYYKGMYGWGDGGSGNARLVSDIRGLSENPDRFPALGEFSRDFVVRHFSLETVSKRLADFCRSALDDIPRLHVTAVDAIRTAAIYLKERRFLTPSRDPMPKQSMVSRLTQ